MRVGKTSHSSAAPVAAATRAAARRPGSRSAPRPSSSAGARALAQARARSPRPGPASGRGKLARGAGPRGSVRGIPLAVGGRDQRRDLARRPRGRRDRLGEVAGELFRAAAAANPGGDRTRERDDVRGERRVIREMPGRVVADQIHDRRAGAPGVVEVRNAVGEAGAEVQERERRAIGHARVAIGRAGADALEEAEHGADSRLAVEGGDQRQLGGAGVREADLEARRAGRPHQALRAVHAGPSAAVDEPSAPRSPALGSRRDGKTQSGLDYPGPDV